MSEKTRTRKSGAKIDKRFSRWIRLYTEALHDPKVVLLSDRQHRVWVNLLMIAGKDRTGALPPIAIVAAELRTTEVEAKAAVDDLILTGLLDLCGGEPGRPVAIRPHNWMMRQHLYAMTSTERSRKHRRAKPTSDAATRCNVAATFLQRNSSESVSSTEARADSAACLPDKNSGGDA